MRVLIVKPSIIKNIVRNPILLKGMKVLIVKPFIMIHILKLCKQDGRNAMSITQILRFSESFSSHLCMPLVQTRLKQIF